MTTHLNFKYKLYFFFYLYIRNKTGRFFKLELFLVHFVNILSRLSTSNFDRACCESTDAMYLIGQTAWFEQWSIDV